MVQKIIRPLFCLAFVFIFNLISGVTCINQAILQYSTSSSGPFSRLGALHIVADDDTRSQVHIDGLSSAAISSLQKLSLDENIRMYITLANDAREKSSNVLTSISLCRIVRSGFALNLTVSLDATDSIVGLYAHTKTESCSDAVTHASDLEAAYLDDAPLRIRVITNFCEHGTQPDADRFLGKIEREQFEKEQKADERGFFSKYWMYIVPGVILYFIFNGAQQPAEGGAGGGSARS